MRIHKIEIHDDYNIDGEIQNTKNKYYLIHGD